MTPSPELLVTIAIVGFYIVGDMLTTVIAVHRYGFYEMNWIIRGIYQRWGVVAMVVLGGLMKTAYAVVCLEMVATAASWSHWVPAVLLGGVGVVATLFNGAQIVIVAAGPRLPISSRWYET